MENIVFYLLYFYKLVFLCCFLPFWDHQHCFRYSLWSLWTAAFVVVHQAVHCPNCRDQQCMLPQSCWHRVQLQPLFCLRCRPTPLCFWRCCWFFYAFVCYWHCCCHLVCCALEVWMMEDWTLFAHLLLSPWLRWFFSTTSLCCVFVVLCVFCVVVEERLGFGVRMRWRR